MNPFKKLLHDAESSDPGISELWTLSLNLQMTSPPMDRTAASQRLLDQIDKQIKLASKADEAGTANDIE